MKRSMKGFASLFAGLLLLTASNPALSQTASNTITIGAIVPLTGAGAQYGKRMQHGIELALEDIAKSKPKHGYQIKVEYADTGDQPSNGPNALRRFKQFQNVPFSLISNSNVTLATLPVAEELKVVLMNGGAQSDKLVGISPWLFSDIPASSYELEVLSAYVLKNIGKQSVVTHQTDPVGQSGLEGWKKFYVGQGGEILASEAVTFEQGDYRSVLTKLRPVMAKTNVWFVAGTYGEDAKRLFSQARSLGISPQIVSASATVTTIPPTDPSIHGVIHVRLRAHPTDDFVKRFKAKYNEEPDFYNTAYYNGVMIFNQALENAVAKKYGTDGEAIRKSIAELRNFDFSAGKVEFNDKNSTTSGLEIVRVKNDGTREVLQSN